MTRKTFVAVAIAALLVVAAAACSGDGGAGGSSGTTVDDGRPVVVVTYPVLGAVVEDLVGDQARVEVLMPPGVDPHDYRPSARDARTVSAAAMVVVNGLGLEESLEDVVGEAEQAGTPVFRAADHVAVRHFGEGEPTEHDHDEASHDEAGHDDGADGHAADDHAADDHGTHDHDEDGTDPHLWVDPIAVRQVVAALAADLQAQLGLDLAARSADLQARLTDLDQRTRDTLAAIPQDRRLLVTGHESMGYFADRYGFRLVGALIPSTTSQAAPSAAELAELRHQIEEARVPAIFNEVGTPPSLARAISEETGVRVVELPTHTLPADGSYFTFIDDIAGPIRAGLAP